MPTRTASPRIPTLALHGIAVEHYPHYHNPKVDLHAINVLLVSFVVSGQGRHVIDTMTYETHGGCIGITRQGEQHSIVTDDRGVEVYNIFLNPSSHPLPLMPLPLRHIQHVLFPAHAGFRHAFNRGIHFELDRPEAMVHCVETIRRESEKPGPGAAELIAAWREVFIITCCRAALDNGIEAVLPQSHGIPAWVPQLCRQLDEKHTEPVSLDSLAGGIGLSKGYLCRAFKRHVGITVVDYLTQRRIESSMQALRGSDDKILAIALASGFSDLSHFNRTFKSRVGVPPSVYRRNVGLHSGY